ncbi:MAG: ABC transporter substrate-binding protein [Deltaproteobacteria bacterium]|nr:ABC transporter substrate-binding protein [Deltaproteobacteria bacterium]
MTRRSRNFNLTLVKSLFTVASILFIVAPPARSQEPIHLALPSRAFQYGIFPIARDRGYMREEGIDLRIVLMQVTPSIQGLMAGHVQFTGAGSSALVAIAKSGAPLKTVLAINDRVHQWVLAKPAIGSLKELKGKKIATTGLASAATFMLRQILAKQGIDPGKDVVFITAPSGNRLTILTSGVVDATIVGSEDRYPGLDQGMKELVNIGNEVKNSWGTVATSDRFIKEHPKLMTAFMRATLKAVRFVRKDREATVSAVVKFTGMQRNLAGRMYDDLIGTFTANGMVDEDIQKNDVAIVAQVADVNEAIAPARAYDFRFVLEADQQLNKSGWRP